jgi:hypothetical protein
MIDLSSKTAVDILEAEVDPDYFNSIMRATGVDQVEMSSYANEMMTALNNSPLSIRELRQKLYNASFRQNFDLATNADGGFIKVTIRYL